MNPAETIALQVEERERQAKELAAWRALRETSAKEWTQVRTLYAEAGKRLDSIGKKPGSIGMNNGDLAIFLRIWRKLISWRPVLRGAMYARH